MRDKNVIEMIYKNFIPVAIFSNLGGDDEEICNYLGEPPSGNPVIRITNYKMNNIMPRFTNDYTAKGLLNYL
jgi:hypothetical protein